MTVSEGPPEVPTPRKFAEGRPTVQGKFLFLGAEKFWVRGISYGTFYMDENRQERLAPETVERDFSQMAACGCLSWISFASTSTSSPEIPSRTISRGCTA